MKTLLQTMNELDSQLAILNIEGICSECNVYEWEEEEFAEATCPFCEGDGYLESVDFSRVDPFLDFECPVCEGSGVIEVTKMVPAKEIEIESNIFL